MMNLQEKIEHAQSLVMMYKLTDDYNDLRIASDFIDNNFFNINEIKQYDLHHYSLIYRKNNVYMLLEKYDKTQIEDYLFQLIDYSTSHFSHDHIEEYGFTGYILKTLLIRRPEIKKKCLGTISFVNWCRKFRTVIIDTSYEELEKYR